MLFCKAFSSLGSRLIPSIPDRSVRNVRNSPPAGEIRCTVKSEVVRFTYALLFKRSTALITYDFDPAGEPPIWTIVHIAASASGEAVSEELRQIAFPWDEPESYFDSQ